MFNQMTFTEMKFALLTPQNKFTPKFRVGGEILTAMAEADPPNQSWNRKSYLEGSIWKDQALLISAVLGRKTFRR